MQWARATSRPCSAVYFATSIAGTDPQRIGAMGPSPPTMSLPSTILPFKMSRDGDAAADMANDEVALIIGAAELCRMADGGLFEIKGVQVHVSIHALNARHTCEVAQLVISGGFTTKAGLPHFTANS